MTGKRWFRVALGMVAAVGLVVGVFASMPGAQAGRSVGSGAVQTVAARAATVLAASGQGGATVSVACPALEGVATRVTCGRIGFCCGGVSIPGITATGQASVKGSGTQARDQAIQRAVADAKDQAQAAAQAAGVKLGQVLNMEISSSGYPYPLSAGGFCGKGGSCPATVAPPVACASGETCPPPVPLPVETFASVTVTWAIA